MTAGTVAILTTLRHQWTDLNTLGVKMRRSGRVNLDVITEWHRAVSTWDNDDRATRSAHDSRWPATVRRLVVR